MLRPKPTRILAPMALAACSNGAGPTGNPTTYPSDAPYLTQVTTAVRNVMVTARAAQRQLGEGASCTLEADLFDPADMASLTPMAVDGECTAYGSSATLDLRAEHWVCAGAVFASYGGQTQSITLCPSIQPTLTSSASVGCNGLTPGGTVEISSASEIDGDTVTDLMGTATLPGAVTIGAPAPQGVATWPAGGPLAVQWTADHTDAALVVLAANAPSAPQPMIVCRPHTGGSVSVSADLLTQTNFRTQDVVVRVFVYRDATTMAESGHTYHLWGAEEAAVLLQRQP